MNKKMGEILKKIRIEKKLTQSEFAHNVISESFYSKVERGKNELNAVDLLNLLQVNNINKEDFFAQLNSKSNNDLQRDLKVQLLNAYSLGDKEKINTLNKQIQNSDYHTNIKISSLLIEAVVNNRVEELTYKEKNQIKRSFFEVDDWTRNITTLQLLCNSMVIFNLDELVLFMKNLEHAYEGKLDKYSFDVQRIIAAICINYFHNCYVYSDFKKADIGFKIIDHLAKIPDLGIYIIVTNFYRSFFKNDKENCKKITDFLNENDLEEITSRLP